MHQAGMTCDVIAAQTGPVRAGHRAFGLDLAARPWLRWDYPAIVAQGEAGDRLKAYGNGDMWRLT